jgi:hypothetical protein
MMPIVPMRVSAPMRAVSLTLVAFASAGGQSGWPVVAGGAIEQ